MSLKLIKEAQVIAKLGDKVEFAKQLQEAFGKQAISEVADIIVENDFSMDMDAATLLDKVTAFAYDEGVPSHMLHDPKVFTRFANEVFIADEEEYGIVMSPSQRRKIAAQAYQLHTQRVSQENEERGAIINAQREQQAAEERFRQERARRREQADNEWATRHIQDPHRRAETISSMEDEESDFDDEYADGYTKYVMRRKQQNRPYVSRRQYEEDRAQMNPWDDYEDEEQGWPSDEEGDYTDYSMRQGEMGNPARQEMMGQDDFDDQYDIGEPMDDEYDMGDEENEEISGENAVAAARDLLAQGAPVLSGIAGGMGKIVDIDNRGVATIKLRGRRLLGVMNISNVPDGLEIIQHNGEYIIRNARRVGMQENEERDPVAPHLQHLFRSAPRGEYNEYNGRGVNPKVAQELAMDREPAPKLTPEQQGWYDAQFGKEAASQDPRYLQGYERWKKVGKPWEKSSQENEEDAGKAGSMLKSLLSQKKEVSAKANDALKKIESEGAKAFHEHRMKAEKAPYHEKKNADEHKAWMKGWMKAAQEHYHPEPVGQPKAKVKPKKK